MESGSGSSSGSSVVSSSKGSSERKERLKSHIKSLKKSSCVRYSHIHKSSQSPSNSVPRLVRSRISANLSSMSKENK